MTQQPSAHARLTLHEAFERFAATVTPDDKRDFADTTIKDVRDGAIDIERQLRARRTQKNMARLEPFLRGVEHYSKVVDVLCNGTPFLPWIWAPVKLMLMITMDSLGAFERLIEAYGKIADALPRFDRLGATLRHDSSIQALLALVYADILEFHRRAYKFVRRRSWAIFFHSMWAGFESRFGVILKNLAYHSELIDRESITVNILDTVAHRKEDAERWDHQERDRQNAKVRTVEAWLTTHDPLPEDVLEKHSRECLSSSCDWFIQHHKTQSWLNDGAGSSLLWIFGKPGAGKSVICSSLIEHAKANQVNIFYYFCSYLSNSTNGLSRLLRSLVTQIIQKYRDLAVYVHDVYFESHPTPSIKALLSLLPELLQGLGSVRFVIDGIDEWDARDQKEVLKELMKVHSTDPSTGICKILFASRDTLELSRSVLKKNKATVPISLSDSDQEVAISRSIEAFIENKLHADLPDHFTELDCHGAILQQVKKVILEKSNGMFLWVRLVLESLDAIYSPEDLCNLVNDLPSDLEALYTCILHRLSHSRGIENYGGVSTILNWICFSKRPLHKLELLYGLALSRNHRTPDVRNIPLKQILDHGKPFIEERPDSTIVFVHFSIKEFLLKANTSAVFQQSQAQLNLSLACATVLISSLDLLIPSISPLKHLERIVDGDYRLLPYAIEYWIEHCLGYAASSALQPDSILSHRLAELWCKHEEVMQISEMRESANANSSKIASESKLDDRLELISHLSICNLIKQVLRLRRSATRSTSMDGEEAEKFAIQNDLTLFSKLAITYEDKLIHLLSQTEVAGITKAALEAFQNSYASNAFRCRFTTCPRVSTGFGSQELRRQHETTHCRRIFCTVEACRYRTIGFKDNGSLNQHKRKYHNGNLTISVPPKVRRQPKEKEESSDLMNQMATTQAHSPTPPHLLPDLNRKGPMRKKLSLSEYQNKRRLLETQREEDVSSRPESHSTDFEFKDTTTRPYDDNTNNANTIHPQVNHNLQYNAEQLQQLERRNRERLLTARREQDISSGL